MATHTPLPLAPPLPDATIATDGAGTATTDDANPHWHMPADTCDHRTYACTDCCPHGDDAD